MHKTKRVLVLGGYGLIGAEMVRALQAAGHRVRALGRNAHTARRVLPDADWLIRDLRDLQTPQAWAEVLRDMDFVVNCAGALQETPGDDLSAVHEGAIAALAAACTQAGAGLIQISAAGVSEASDIAFFASKARGDAAIRAARGDWWVLRPGLVLAPTGYGGTLLLRMLAAVPLIQPLALARAQVQTVSVHDVAAAVGRALEGDLPPGETYDLVEDTAHSLSALVAAYRRWLGFGPARGEFSLPAALTWPMAKAADVLGRLGWRPPLRTTAMRVLADGVRGDAAQTRVALGRPALTLSESLVTMPARAEDRVAARMALLAPVVLATLALFWALSGLIGLWSLEAAAAVLTAEGWSPTAAKTSVLFWAAVDLALAGGLLIRRHARTACLGMVAVSLIYLISASFITPQMWADPLGPLIKVFPGIALALVARALLESR